MFLQNMMSRRYNIYILIFVFSFHQLFSQQSRNSLERERDVNLSKIEEAEKIIIQTEKSKKITVGKLNVINKQIKNRQDLILNLKKDVRNQKNEIVTLRSLISSLKSDFKILSDEYSEMILPTFLPRWKGSNSRFISSSGIPIP